ncbi:MAG: hypothetical protein Q9164_007626 [Protoblastenia rupestris]
MSSVWSQNFLLCWYKTESSTVIQHLQTLALRFQGPEQRVMRDEILQRALNHMVERLKVSDDLRSRRWWMPSDFEWMVKDKDSSWTQWNLPTIQDADLDTFNLSDFKQRPRLLVPTYSHGRAWTMTAPPASQNPQATMQGAFLPDRTNTTPTPTGCHPVGGSSSEQAPPVTSAEQTDRSSPVTQRAPPSTPTRNQRGKIQKKRKETRVAIPPRVRASPVLPSEGYIWGQVPPRLPALDANGLISSRAGCVQAAMGRRTEGEWVEIRVPPDDDDTNGQWGGTAKHCVADFCKLSTDTKNKIEQPLPQDLAALALLSDTFRIEMNQGGKACTRHVWLLVEKLGVPPERVSPQGLVRLDLALRAAKELLLLPLEEEEAED